MNTFQREEKVRKFKIINGRGNIKETVGIDKLKYIL
jgi:hypothetical protein